MRVMFVIPGTGEGSSMIFARRQAQAVRTQGVEVREFFLRSRTSAARMVSEMVRFRREIREFRPDAAHAHYGTVTALFTALAIAAYGGKIPLVITYRGSDLNPCRGWPKIRTALAHLFSQLAALRAAKIVCVSAHLRERLWWRRSSAKVLASGVDSSVFVPGGRAEARKKLGWDARPMVLFHCGRDPQVKRRDLAERAMAVARGKSPDLHWEVLDGSTAPEMMPVLMNAADCLLVTSDYEGSPTVVQEALASNLPIVSVEVGDVARRIEGAKNSRIIERDAERLGLTVAEIVDPPRRSDGRAKIGEFCSDRIAAELVRIYREVTAGET